MVTCFKDTVGSGGVEIPSPFMKSDPLNHEKKNVNFPSGVACAKYTDGSQAAYDISSQVKEIECQNAGLVQQGNGPAMVIRNESSRETQIVNSETNKSSPGMPAREVKPTQVIELSDDEIEVLDLKNQEQTALENPEDKSVVLRGSAKTGTGPLPNDFAKEME